MEYRIKKNPEVLNFELLRLCFEVYAVKAENVAELASSIDALGKAERRRLCKQFRVSHGIPHPQRHKHRDLEPRINEFPAVPQKLNLSQNQPDYIPLPAPSPKPAAPLSAKKLRKFKLAAKKEKKAARQEFRRANLNAAASAPVMSRPSEDAIREFYASWEWKRLSYDAKLERSRKCECCGAKAPEVRIHTDHVKPIRHYWHLRLVRSNLQILCEDCNMGKGSRDETDFRQTVQEDDLGVLLEEPKIPVIWN
ncbi:HNH endonuclease [Bradyrhizobium sp. URHD0069]|uniref:HNH endonuclease n=1 Tax=Bradyrhizobium sp. URHD0069 TaxID=1380355 RepID=UPI0018CC3409|nr:HNH endonuclease signature motif containing protein [Bradyrhizobium sp. URHD0069]